MVGEKGQWGRPAVSKRPLGHDAKALHAGQKRGVGRQVVEKREAVKLRCLRI